MPRTQLIIDCDPGIDDAIAIALAVASPEVELLAVTTVAGNAPLGITTSNARRLLRAFGRDDVVVAAGADRGLVRVKPDHPLIHGPNGLGGVELAEPVVDPSGEHAVTLMGRLLREREPGTVTVAAIGPLTNIALLLALHPDAASGIRRLVIMGGSTSVGNVTEYAEYNMWSDPEAARRVFDHPDLEVCVLDLELTRRATVDEQDLLRFESCADRGALAAAMIRGYSDRAATGWPLYDAVVTASIADPPMVDLRATIVSVDTGDGPTRGRTSFAAEADAGDQCTLVAHQLDLERFRTLLFDRIDAPLYR